jgi:hypothetical protein
MIANWRLLIADLTGPKTRTMKSAVNKSDQYLFQSAIGNRQSAILLR